MGSKNFYLDYETETALKNIIEKEPDFNLSNFLQKCIIDYYKEEENISPKEYEIEINKKRNRLNEIREEMDLLEEKKRKAELQAEMKKKQEAEAELRAKRKKQEKIMTQIDNLLTFWHIDKKEAEKLAEEYVEEGEGTIFDFMKEKDYDEIREEEKEE